MRLVHTYEPKPGAFSFKVGSPVFKQLGAHDVCAYADDQDNNPLPAAKAIGSIEVTAATG